MPDPENQRQDNTETGGQRTIDSLIQIVVSEDKFQATFRFVGKIEDVPKITEGALVNVLEEKGIVTGVTNNALKELIIKLKAGDYSETLLAEGIPPKVEFSPDIMLAFMGITDVKTLAEVEALKVMHHTLVQDICPIDRVDVGAEVLKLAIEDMVIDGIDVYGKPIEASIDNLFKTGNGVAYYPQRKTYLAEETGVICVVDAELSILPVNFDGYVDVQISPDKTNATITVYPPDFKGKAIDLDAALESMKQAGIRTGYKTEEIDEALDDCRANFKVVEVLAAEEIKAVDGIDGKVEHLLAFETSLKPSIREDGSADFKDVSVIKPVKKLQKLAKLHAPTLGTPGTGIQGEVLPAKDGVHVVLPGGNNTEISASDETLLVASVSGNARLTGKFIEVSECFVVEQHVDFSTGNIAYPKTLMVKGDVKAGFNIDVGQDVEIFGLVEDCRIKAGGKVLIKSGFVGNGAGVIEAADEVGILYVRNQMVRSRKNICIAKEVVNAQIFARGSLEVGGQKIGIVGGHVSARREIICEAAGNINGTKTLLEAGVDYALLEERYTTNEKIKTYRAKSDKIEEHLKRLARKRQKGEELSKKELEIVTKLSETQKKLNKQLDSFKERRKIIEEKLADNESARIIIRREFYPGVTIKIGEYFFNVNKKMMGPKTFVIQDGQVTAL
ncbi:MAG: DUF342 domain-containing protein [Fibrobacteria bacterium]|nr:DUF342 domain-containing protein [Fibrobacteria bacterium]